jgi:hypothetical protein
MAACVLQLHDVSSAALERDEFKMKNESSSRPSSLFEHDLFEKPVSTFPGHALTKWDDLPPLHIHARAARRRG